LPSALTSLGGAPPAPNPVPQPPAQPQASALAGGAPQAPPSQLQIPPAPDHQQTVAALRHFDAIENALVALLKDPAVGKSDLRSSAIDQMTKLVARGIMTPATAVTQLSDFPDKPFDQKMWLQGHLQQTIQGATMVLAHHQAAFAGQDVDTTPPSPDDHQNAISGLISMYKGNGQNA
jgi:hypothetical protein